MTISSKTKKAVAAGTLVLAGVGAGAVVASNGSASAETDATTSTTASGDPSMSVRSDEVLLTGTELEEVTAAAMAAYPDATIQRAETDSDGVYEAHMVTADGEQIIVQVGEDFTVTGTQTGGGGPHDGPGESSTAG